MSLWFLFFTGILQMVFRGERKTQLPLAKHRISHLSHHFTRFPSVLFWTVLLTPPEGILCDLPDWYVHQLRLRAAS